MMVIPHDYNEIKNSYHLRISLSVPRHTSHVCSTGMNNTTVLVCEGIAMYLCTAGDKLLSKLVFCIFIMIFAKSLLCLSSKKSLWFTEKPYAISQHSGA